MGYLLFFVIVWGIIFFIQYLLCTKIETILIKLIPTFIFVIFMTFSFMLSTDRGGWIDFSSAGTFLMIVVVLMIGSPIAAAWYFSK